MLYFSLVMFYGNYLNVSCDKLKTNVKANCSQRIKMPWPESMLFRSKTSNQDVIRNHFDLLYLSYFRYVDVL